MTTQEKICSILTKLQDENLSEWEKRDFAQEGMNLTRLTVETDGVGSKILYLYFLKVNLSVRWSLPSLFGRLYYFLSIIRLKNHRMDSELLNQLVKQTESADFRSFLVRFKKLKVG